MGRASRPGGALVRMGGPMPPLYAQDPLSALHRGLEWRWLDLPFAVMEVAGQGWALALIALAFYSWFEHEVKDVLKAFLPLALALAAAGALAVVARVLGAVPRPVGGAGQGVVPLLHHAFPSGQVAAAAVFATYSLLAYGRRARATLLLALAVAAARALSGPHGPLALVAGGIAGVALGALAYRAAVRVSPGGHLARLRSIRRAARAAEVADPPSA